MKRIIYSFVSACLLLSSCSMDEIPQASVDKDTVFRTEKGLETYSYSFYNMLPSVSDGFRQDAMCDYGAVTSFDNFIREGAYSAELSSGWSWSDLRNINYFIENCTTRRSMSLSVTTISAWPAFSAPISITRWWCVSVMCPG